MAEATAYTTVAQLAALLNVNATTREADLIRHLEAAAKEIDSEIGGEGGLAGGWSDDPQALNLLGKVNLNRAQDTWQVEVTATAGILGLGSDSPVFVPRNSWEVYANMLTPLKTEWAFG